MLSALFTPDAFPQVSWTSIGPGGGGWLSAITVINDAEETVYVGCDVGGIYRSVDHGASWEILNDGLSDVYVQDIAYDRQNPAVLYAGTRGGVFKSIDGGRHWIAKRNGFPPLEEFSFSAPISDVEVDPTNPRIVYAGVGITRAGYELDGYHWQTAGMKGTVFKSVDSGESWTPIRNTGIEPSAMIYSLKIDPSDPAVLWAASSAGVSVSRNAAETWEPKNSGLPHLLTMGLVIDPLDTDTLYVTLWARPGSASWRGGVYRSSDGGNHWVAVNDGLPQVVGDEEGFTSNFPTIVIDPVDPRILYVGNTPWTPDPGVYKTTDRGEHWTWISRYDEPDPNLDIGWITEHGLFVKCLAIDPNDPQRLYFGTSTHLFRTDDGGGNWLQVYSEPTENGFWHGTGLETTVVEAIAVDPTNPDTLYVGYWDMGFLKSVDGGFSFKRTFTGMNYHSNTFAIVVDPDDPSTVYAATGWWDTNEGEVCKSVDSGETWTVLDNGIPDAQIWSMALDETTPPEARTLYAASYEHGVYTSIDGGRHWNSTSDGLGVDGNLRVRSIVINPDDPSVLYAGIEAEDLEFPDHIETIQGGLFRSVDAGLHWTRLGIDTPRLIDVRDITIDPEDTDVLYVAVHHHYDHTVGETFFGGVYKSVDGGRSWIAVNDGFGSPDHLNVVSVALNPENSRIVYAVTTDAPYHDRSGGRGIFKSTNGGRCWFPINAGLGIHCFSRIIVDPVDPSRLYAGSDGNGLFRGTDTNVSGALRSCRRDANERPIPQ